MAFVMKRFQMTERRACKLVGLDRSSYRYMPRPDRNAALRQELINLALRKPWYGYRQLHALLIRRGFQVSAQRLYRLYKTEGLMCRRRRRNARPARRRFLFPGNTEQTTFWSR